MHQMSDIDYPFKLECNTTLNLQVDLDKEKNSKIRGSKTKVVEKNRARTLWDLKMAGRKKEKNNNRKIQN